MRLETPRSARTFQLLFVAALSTVALACAPSQGSVASYDFPEPIPESDVTAAEVRERGRPLLLDQLVPVEISADLHEAEVEALARCMEARGLVVNLPDFAALPLALESDRILERAAYGISDGDILRDGTIGISSLLRRFQLASISVEPDQQPGEQWFVALFGEPEATDLVSITTAEGMVLSIPRESCTWQALQKIFDGPEQMFAFQNTPGRLQSEVDALLDDAIAVSAATSAWSACMGSEGFDYPSPRALWADVLIRATADLSDGEQFEAEAAPFAALCTTSSGLLQATVELLPGIEQDVLFRRGAEVAELESILSSARTNAGS